MQKAVEYKLMIEYNPLPIHKIRIKIRWQRPPKGWFKINVDDSHNNFNSSLRGVFRDNNGHWIVGFTKNIEVIGSLEAELKAIKKGLKTAHKWNLFPLQIEIDYAEAIEAIVVNAPREGDPPSTLV
ncbi:uncharacterized protein [Nicotiana sylvestris]|uniref:uncharacterized protein n=1 Tax=Nicotiana sylvestris TaxID=4096 RepID=UPI00388CD76C